MRTQRVILNTRQEADRYLPRNGQVFLVREGNQLRVGHNNVRGGWYIEGNPLYDLGLGDTVPQAGNIQLGYFGSLSDSDFITRSQLSSVTGLSLGSGTITWLKLLYQERVLWMSQTPIVTTLTWDQLYDAGCVFGISGEGTPLTNTPTNQKVTVTIGEDNYKVRLPTEAEFTTLIPALVTDFVREKPLLNFTETTLGLMSQEVDGVTVYSGTWLQDTTDEGQVRVGGVVYNPMDTRVVWQDLEQAMSLSSDITQWTTENGQHQVQLTWRPVLELDRSIHTTTT